MTAVNADIDDLIRRALREDLGDRGDITSTSVIAVDSMSLARIVARQAGCVAGVDVAAACFHHLDPTLDVQILASDGSIVQSAATLVTIAGHTRPILGAERVALNLLGHLSGIATATRSFVDAVAGTTAQISDTRKTTPVLRNLEKAAVVAGGGRNHRFGLYDAVLIKDNHIAAAGSIRSAVAAARADVGDTVRIEVEVDTLDQLDEVLGTDADAVLLDNMDVDTLARAVATVDHRMTTEASGGITLDTVRRVAETGVDVISVGWLTHSAPNLDVALEVSDSD